MKTIISSLLLASALGLAPAAQGKTPPALNLTVRPEREIILVGGPRQTVIQVEVAAPPTPDQKRTTPLNLALVLDRSSSMTGEKIEKARQAAEIALDQLGPDDYLALVIYDNDVEVLVPSQKVTDKDALREKIRAIRPRGSTALYGGVDQGAAELRKYLDKERISRVVLLSDGQANVGPSSPADLSRLGTALRAEGIGVSTVGLGEDYNEDLMTALAESAHGNYYYVRDAEKLPGIFAEELGTVKSIAGRDVRIIITLPPGVKPLRVLGDEGIVFHGQTATIPLAEFSAAQTRRFLVACEAPDVSDEQIDMARVELAYVDAGRNLPVTQTATATVRQSSDVVASERSIQAAVASQVAITHNRLAKEEAVRLADQGRVKEAAAVLDRQYQANAALPAPAQSSLLQAEQGSLRSRIGDMLSDKGLSRSARKAMTYENYQDKTQKR